MKTTTCISMMGLAAAVCIAFQCTAVAAEQTAPNGKTATIGKKRLAAAGVVAAAPRSSEANQLPLLDQAYGLLRVADHDYKGHRARAMHQIEDAAKELGGKLSGGGKAGENQGTSDSQLRNAQGLLQQAVSGLRGKAHGHIEAAIKQLTIALSVK